eukprot:1805553-Pyramimonas_sp.AAC.1
MDPYKQLMPAPVHTTDGTPVDDEGRHLGTAMRCSTPEVDEAQFAYMTVNLGPTMNAFPFEIEEQSLQCDGVS